MKFLTRFGASAGTALAVLVVLIACGPSTGTDALLSASPLPSPSLTAAGSASPPPAATTAAPTPAATTAAPTTAPSPSATPAPTEAPTETPSAARTSEPTDTPRPTKTSEPAKTPEPTPTPTPTPTVAAGYPGGISSSSGTVIPGFTRYGGKVTDAATGAPIAGVCVYAGPPAGCPVPNLNTDASGNFAFDFPSGTTWQFNFEHPRYVAQLQKTGTTINVAMVKK